MSTINITINIPLLLLFKLGLWRKDQISEKNIFKIKSPGQSRPGQKTFLFLPETVYSLEILKLNFLLRRAVINLIDYWNFLSWLQFLLEKKTCLIPWLGNILFIIQRSMRRNLADRLTSRFSVHAFSLYWRREGKVDGVRFVGFLTSDVTLHLQNSFFFKAAVKAARPF